LASVLKAIFHPTVKPPDHKITIEIELKYRQFQQLDFYGQPVNQKTLTKGIPRDKKLP
jgi:hypothetical protein